MKYEDNMYEAIEMSALLFYYQLRLWKWKWKWKEECFRPKNKKEQKVNLITQKYQSRNVFSQKMILLC